MKTTLLAGIALAGWDSLGWIGAGVARSGRDRWLARWMLWRDRRAPLAALVLLAAYGALVLAVAGWTGQQWLGWAIEPLSPAMRLLFAANGVLLLWRLGMRGFFTARWYGLPQAMRLADNFGQTTQLVFAKVERNPRLEADTFQFTPPKGADVLTE